MKQESIWRVGIFILIMMASLMFIASAQALVLVDPPHDCALSDFTGTSECAGTFEGNDDATGLNDEVLFGISDWVELAKVDAQSGTVTNFITVGAPSSGTQTWGFDGTFDPFSFANLTFVLKGGPTFSAYLWDGIATSGTFDTDGILTGGGGAGPDLSHFTLYGSNSEPVPEPSSLALIAFGLAFLAWRSRRRFL